MTRGRVDVDDDGVDDDDESLPCTARAIRSYRPYTRNVSASVLRIVTFTVVPARTRSSGPGMFGARPASANAGIATPGALSPSGCQAPIVASSASKCTPSRIWPAG